MSFPHLSAAEAAAMIPHGATVGFSGFTPAGSAKSIPVAIAARARREHAAGHPYAIRVLAGASTGKNLDRELTMADAVSYRAPYQSDSLMRERINEGKIAFVDMHLSQFPQMVLQGFLGKLDYAVVEATEVTPDGRVYLTTSIGASPSFLQAARRVFIELNHKQNPRIRDMADILVPAPPPNRQTLDITHVGSRIGQPYAWVDPSKIAGIVETSSLDHVEPFALSTEPAKKIARFVAEFLVSEMKAGRIPKEFLPLQAGIGNTCNAVMAELGDCSDIPDFCMYSEVCQNSMLDLIDRGRLKMISTTALTLTDDYMERVFANMDHYLQHIILRPQEISNSAEVVRRLGVISINTALEADLMGNVNSSHVLGTKIMNGIGGSGDFTRNAYLSMFICPSTAKGGAISSIVPMCSHIDHNEHSVAIIVTDQGYADLRGKDPRERALTMIEKCAHPDFKDDLWRYVHGVSKVHMPHDLNRAFAMHRHYQAGGSMRGMRWDQFV